MRVAIAGGGIAGLACAWRLSARHEVTVFEAASRVGGHARTVPVTLEDGTHQVDTGFVVYNRPNYPRFGALLEELGVSGRATSMSFSVCAPERDFEYQGGSLAGLLAQPANALSPRFRRMVRDILRFHRAAPRLLADAADETDALSVAEFARVEGLSEGFLEDYLVPLTAALWSAPPRAARAFPARFVARFLAQHGMLRVWGRPQWLTVPGGARGYLDRLVEALPARICRDAPVRAVRAAGPEAVVETPQDTGRFDHAVIACHADQALSIVSDPTPTERSVLAAFPFQANDAVLHTHPEPVMPRRRRAWASWNALVPRSDPDRACVTYWMNSLQRFTSARPICVTLNDHDRIDPDAVHDRVRFEHPLAAEGQDRARARHGALIGATRSYCGAYWGFGFHEDGVASAERVCAALDGAGPAPGEAAA